MTTTQSLVPAAARAAADEGLRSSSDASGNRRQAVGDALAIIAMFAVAVSVVVWRRPDAVTYPQFWAEDGHNWFADAYNMGVASLLRSEAGYLQTLPRLVAVPAAHLSIVHAALLFNLVGISIQAAPAAFFMSRRFEDVAPSVWVRGIVAFLYLLIPSFELNATITNAQWHLSILAAMVLVAGPPRRPWWRLFDCSVLISCGLTGPFALLLLPAAMVRMLMIRAQRRWYGALSGIIAVTLVLQAWTVLHSHRDTTAALGASLKNAAFMIADRVVLAGSFAEEGHTHVYTQGSTHGAVIAVILTILAVAVVGFVALRSCWAMRVFLFVCFGITAVAMLSPLASASATPAWTVMATSDAGERYFFSAELAWLVCVVWALSRLPIRVLRYGMEAVTIVVFASGIVAYTQYAPYTDFHPSTYDEQLRAAAPGTVVSVPINPSWTMTLKKRN